MQYHSVLLTNKKDQFGASSNHISYPLTKALAMLFFIHGYKKLLVASSSALRMMFSVCETFSSSKKTQLVYMFQQAHIFTTLQRVFVPDQATHLGRTTIPATNEGQIRCMYARAELQVLYIVVTQ